MVTHTKSTAISGRVLIVEDDEDARLLLRFILEKSGLMVSSAVDGEQALSYIQENSPPDLVLLDVMMPYMNGFDILSSIRQTPEWKDVPVIILTANENEDDIQRGYELGIIDYIIKPFNSNDLTERVSRVMPPIDDVPNAKK